MQMSEVHLGTAAAEVAEPTTHYPNIVLLGLRALKRMDHQLFEVITGHVSLLLAIELAMMEITAAHDQGDVNATAATEENNVQFTINDDVKKLVAGLQSTLAAAESDRRKTPLLDAWNTAFGMLLESIDQRVAEISGNVEFLLATKEAQLNTKLLMLRFLHVVYKENGLLGEKEDEDKKTQVCSRDFLAGALGPCADTCRTRHLFTPSNRQILEQAAKGLDLPDQVRFRVSFPDHPEFRTYDFHGNFNVDNENVHAVNILWQSLNFLLSTVADDMEMTSLIWEICPRLTLAFAHLNIIIQANLLPTCKLLLILQEPMGYGRGTHTKLYGATGVAGDQLFAASWNRATQKRLGAFICGDGGDNDQEIFGASFDFVVHTGDLICINTSPFLFTTRKQRPIQALQLSGQHGCTVALLATLVKLALSGLGRDSESTFEIQSRRQPGKHVRHVYHPVAGHYVWPAIAACGDEVQTYTLKALHISLQADVHHPSALCPPYEFTQSARGSKRVSYEVPNNVTRMGLPRLRLLFMGTTHPSSNHQRENPSAAHWSSSYDIERRHQWKKILEDRCPTLFAPKTIQSSQELLRSMDTCLLKIMPFFSVEDHDLQ